MQDRSGLLKEEKNIKKDICAKWGKYKILRDLDDEVIRENVALVMETIRIENEKEDAMAQFKRISISLAHRVFPSLNAHNLVSVQPLLAQDWFYRYIENNSEKIKPIVAETRKLKICWPFSEQQSGLHYEAELTAILAEEMRSEIDREIVSDLLYNASFERRVTGELWEQVLDTAELIGLSINRTKANWLVTTPEMNLRSRDDINVYTDISFPENTILMGYRGFNEFDAGYVYCPYRLIHMAKSVDNAFFPRRPLVTTRAKRFLNNDFYAVLRV